MLFCITTTFRPIYAAHKCSSLVMWRGHFPQPPIWAPFATAWIRQCKWFVNRTAGCVLDCSYLDQCYCSSTPNFAVSDARNRAMAGSDDGEARHQRAGYACSEPEITTAPASDLAMRSDTLMSPRVSPLLWFQQCLLPSLVVTSASQRKHGK